MSPEAQPVTSAWTSMPSTPGIYWRRVTLHDGAIYSTRIQPVVRVAGALYYADENYFFTTPVVHNDLVTWNGPLIAPPNAVGSEAAP